MSQGKLVRDKMPQIIRSKGQEPIVYVADAEEYAARLRDKLIEEVAEFLASDNDPKELADILEVVYALAGQVGLKSDERGTFGALDLEVPDVDIELLVRREVPAQHSADLGSR